MGVVGTVAADLRQDFRAEGERAQGCLAAPAARDSHHAVVISRSCGNSASLSRTEYTRIESPRDFGSPLEVPPERRRRLSRQAPTWVPASETLGEGVFVQFSEKAVAAWLEKNKAYDREFFEGHRRWRAARGLDDPEKA
jgi:hypothetical protein